MNESPFLDSVYALNDAKPAFFEVAGSEHTGGGLVAAVGRVAHRWVLLERHSRNATSNVVLFDQISLLQNRLVNLGLMMSHVQLKAGSHKYARQSLTELATDIASLNASRVKALSNDRSVASTITHEQFAGLTRFLQDGTQMTPSLT